MNIVIMMGRSKGKFKKESTKTAVKERNKTRNLKSFWIRNNLKKVNKTVIKIIKYVKPPKNPSSVVNSKKSLWAW